MAANGLTANWAEAYTVRIAHTSLYEINEEPHHVSTNSQLMATKETGKYGNILYGINILFENVTT